MIGTVQFNGEVDNIESNINKVDSFDESISEEEAKQKYPSVLCLKKHIDQTYSPTSENAQSGIAVAEAIAPLSERVSKNDAELANIRVDTNGTTYSSAGEAVRRQIDALKSDISNKYAKLGYQKIIVKTDELINSVPNNNTGIISNDAWNGNRKHCKINVESYDTIKFTGRSHQVSCSWWYDASDNPISAVGGAKEFIGGEIKIPENAVWFRCPGTLSQWADETYSTFELFAHNNDSNIYNIKKKISEIDENVKQNTSDIESYESHFSDIERYENNNDVEKYNIGSWIISKKTGKTVILDTNDITKSIGIKLYGKSNNPSEPDENGLYNLCGVNIADSIKITLTNVKASYDSKSVSIPCTISELHGLKFIQAVYGRIYGYTYIQDDEYYISDYVEINMDGSVVYVKNIGELVLTGDESSLSNINLVRWDILEKFLKTYCFACNVSNKEVNVDYTNGIRIPYTGDNFKESAKAMYEAGTPYIIYGVLKEPERIVLAENFNTNIKYNTEIDAGGLDMTTADNIKTNAYKFLYLLRQLKKNMDGEPTHYLMNADMYAIFQTVADYVPNVRYTKDEMGNDVLKYGAGVIVEMGDKPGTSNPIIATTAPSTTAFGTSDIYAVRIGMDGVHGVSPEGSNLVKTYLPDLTTPGAVKKGEVEMVAAIAVKTSRAVGKIKGIAVLPKTKA